MTRYKYRLRNNLEKMYPLRRYIFRMCTLFGTLSLILFTINSFFSSSDTFTLPTLLTETPLPTLPSTHNHSTTSTSIKNDLTTSTVRESNIPDIFDLSLWRHALVGNRGNQTLCTVPSRYLPIANAYCHAQGRDDCPEVPCTLIYITDEFTRNVECLRGGRVAIGVQPDWICRKSAALELFSNINKKPSIQAEAYTRLTSELYEQALGPYREEGVTKWGLTLEGESIGYYPSVVFKTRLLPLFDITIGYDRRIFDLITDLYLLDYADLITNRQKRRLTMRQIFENKVKGRAPILWINSNCDTPSNRTGYMLELMRYISVDVRGKCGNPNWNETVNQSDIDPQQFAKNKLLLAGEYLFTVAIENTLEYDYVTEKLWQPLAAGSVPIYLGAPNIDDWLPCTNYSCIINLRQFPSPQEAASFIQSLVKYRGRYIRYHQWRLDQFMRPSFLKMIDYFQEADKYSVECLICDMVYRRDRGTTRRKLLTANNPFNDTFPSLD